jgi:hypothetical protein
MNYMTIFCKLLMEKKQETYPHTLMSKLLRFLYFFTYMILRKDYLDKIYLWYKK